MDKFFICLTSKPMQITLMWKSVLLYYAVIIRKKTVCWRLMYTLFGEKSKFHFRKICSLFAGLIYPSINPTIFPQSLIHTRSLTKAEWFLHKEEQSECISMFLRVGIQMYSHISTLWKICGPAKSKRTKLRLLRT